MIEEWKDIPGYEGLYQVSNLGKIRSINYNRKGLIELLKPSYTSRIYSKVSLYKNKVRKTFLINRLVAIVYLKNPYNKPFSCHIDETLDENGVLYNGADNLFWGTNKENIQDCHRKGRSNNNLQNNHPSKGMFGKDHCCSKKVNQYTKDLEFIKTWDSMMDIQRELGIYQGNISACCRGVVKTTSGYIWEFEKKVESITK